jgi:hypothetical protein
MSATDLEVRVSRLLYRVSEAATALGLSLAKVYVLRRELCDAWREHGLVFPSSIGTPIEPRNVNRRWDVLRKKVLTTCSERKVSGIGSRFGSRTGCFMIASGVWPGALGGTRTPNLLIRSQMLYPLSYERWCLASLRHSEGALRQRARAPHRSSNSARPCTLISRRIRSALRA